MRPTVRSRPFGTLPDNTPVTLYSILDSIELHVLDFGAIITSIRTPDRHGAMGEIVLGHDSLRPYQHNPAYLGAVVGRYANRIAAGRFTLGTRSYQLGTNEGANHLHGGYRGFDQRMWKATVIEQHDGAAVRLTRTSPHGEEGYPGTLHASVTYLVRNSAITIAYEASSDATTICNLTQHTYFNLGLEMTDVIVDHELLIHADRYVPVDDTLIPTGELATVAGTPLDFQQRMRIGSQLLRSDEQLRIARGFDHTLVLPAAPGELKCAAELRDPRSGRILEVLTVEPGVQFYSGQALSGSFVPHAGLCLETQHFPDSPNRAHFPSTVLRPGQLYQSSTIWQFRTE